MSADPPPVRRQPRAHGGRGGSRPQLEWWKAPLAASEIRDNDVLATLYRIGAAMKMEHLQGRDAGVLLVGPDRAQSLTQKRRTDRAFALLWDLPEEVPELQVSKDAPKWQEFGKRPANFLRIEWPKMAELLDSGTRRSPAERSEEKRRKKKRSEETAMPALAADGGPLASSRSKRPGFARRKEGKRPNGPGDLECFQDAVPSALCGQCGKRGLLVNGEILCGKCGVKTLAGRREG